MAVKQDARATLEDIANRVGVTKMTVSRALRGVGRISEPTRRHVRKVAEELGYLATNQGVLAAPAHRGGSDLRLQLLVARTSHEENDLSRELLRGMQDRLALTAGHIETLVCTSLPDLLDAWDACRAHALILRNQLPAAWVEHLLRRGPVVYATSNDVYAGVDAVYCTELRTATLVARHLADRDHRVLSWFGFFDTHTGNELLDEDEADDGRIASIHGPRYAAWNYVSHYGSRRDTHSLVLLERDWRSDSLADVVRRGLAAILTARPRPTAVVVPTDCVGVAMIEQAREVGLRVPEDLSIVAYGGTDAAHVTTPVLTCVKLPFYTIGRAIPELVERRLADPQATPVTLQFEATIEPGASVATLSGSTTQ